jgi:hypothetical protein
MGLPTFDVDLEPLSNKARILGGMCSVEIQASQEPIANRPRDAIPPHKSNRRACVCHTLGFQFVSG